MSRPRRALVTGIRGQDGAYLAKTLLDEGYEVFGADRRNSDSTHWRMRRLGIEERVPVLYMDLTEFSNILRVLEDVRPDEIYNLAAQSFVAVSFDQPMVTTQVNATGVLHVLEAIRSVLPEARFYQASSSEMFGRVREIPQTEATPFHPRSPYGVSKAYAHWITVNFREAHGLHASSGICFNHESPLRGTEFVTRKITRAVARIQTGQQERISLGNLDARRDWGFAGDYARGMWQMVQQAEADDYVLATGVSHSVREFVEAAFEAVGERIDWDGEGLEERGRDAAGHVRVVIDPAFRRPAEVDLLLGDATKAKDKLGWKPTLSFESLVTLMVEDDCKAVRGEVPS